jgi:hypothetical protein
MQGGGLEVIVAETVDSASIVAWSCNQICQIAFDRYFLLVYTCEIRIPFLLGCGWNNLETQCQFLSRTEARGNHGQLSMYY